MAVEIKLVRGAQSINLTASPYGVGMDFYPPALIPSYVIGSGTSANKTRGGKLYSTKYNNRELNFSVLLKTTTTTTAQAAARKLIAFVAAGEGLQLKYRPNSALPVPQWGQFGAPITYDVISGHVGEVDDQFTETGAVTYSVMLYLTVSPIARGTRQRMANGSGGLYENAVGSVDGVSKSLLIPEATVNLFRNPVFYADTYDLTWDDQDNVLKELNTDPEFIYPGLFASMKATPRATTLNAVYSSCTLTATGTHTLSFVVRKEDGSAITTADVGAYFAGAGQTATIESLGNGWYLGYYSASASAGAADYGVVVKRPLYIAAAQLENKAYPTPIAYDSAHGCYNGGGYYGIYAPTRTAAMLRLPTSTTLFRGAGAITWIWRAGFANTFSSNATFFKMEGVSFQAVFTASGDTIAFGDGTNSATSTAQTFSRGDVLYFTATWGTSGLALYKNGSLIASNATYTPPPIFGAYVSIGGDDGTSYTGGEYISFETYDRQITAAEVLEWYTSAANVLAGDVRPGAIPWFSTLAADGRLTNANDSTANNWGCGGGVPGSYDAKTEIVSAGSTVTGETYTFSMMQSPYFINPRYFFTNAGGYGTDTTCNADDYMQDNIGGPDVAYFESSFAKDLAYFMSGKEFIVYARCSDSASTTFEVYASTYVSSYRINGRKQYVNLGTSYRLINTGPMVMRDFSKSANVLGLGMRINAGIKFVRASGSGNMKWDYSQILTRPILRVNLDQSGSYPGLVIDGATVFDYSAYLGTVGDNRITAVGDELTMLPGHYNSLVALIGSATKDPQVTYTADLTINITPGWGLM